MKNPIRQTNAIKYELSRAFERVVLAWDRLSHSTYNGDGMRLRGRNLSFLADERFKCAYRRGMNSGHHYLRPAGSEINVPMEFRVYIECWAAEYGAHLDGDFVSCGVNTGGRALAICEYVDINKTGRTYWLFDTFKGIPEHQMLDTEREARIADNELLYSESYDLAVKNFSPFPNAKLVRGTVPETLSTVQIDKVAYLAIDMNIAYPERKAIEHFWPKLSRGAIVILDDYGFSPYIEQKRTMDEFATVMGVSILTLPTGQGMLIKR